MRTAVACTCKAPLRRRDGDVKLVERVAGSCDVLELSGGVRCVAKCLSTPRFQRKCVPRQSQPLRLGGTVMASQNSVLGQERLIRASAQVNPGVLIVARTRESIYVSTSLLLVAGKQHLRLGMGAVAITGLRYTLTLLPFVTVPSFHESVDFNATVINAVYKLADGLLPCSRSLFNTGLAGQGTPPTGLSR